MCTLMLCIWITYFYRYVVSSCVVVMVPDGVVALQTTNRK